jgi:hypothetical protein
MKPFVRCVNSPVAWVLALILAGTSAIAFGIVGIGRDGGFADGQLDMTSLYAAGRCLSQGLSPYDPVAACSQEVTRIFQEVTRIQEITGLSNNPYAYPPQMAPLSILLSYLSFSWARVLIIGINLACIIGLAALCAMPPKSETDLGVPDPAPEARWLIPALILGNPFTAHILWMGQTTLIATASLAGGWVWARRGHVWLGGALIAFGTVKPQIAVLVVLWFLLERRWKVLTIGAAFALVLSLPEILASGPIGAFTGWLSAIGPYLQLEYNMIGFRGVFGLQNFLAAIGFDVPPLLPVGVAAMMVLWWLRKHIADPDILPLLIGLSLVFGYSHEYDVSALVLLLPAFWRHLRGREVEALVAALLMLVLFLPQRILWAHSRPRTVLSLPLEDAFLLQYRVLVVLGFVIWLLVLTVRQSTDPHSVHGGVLRTR